MLATAAVEVTPGVAERSPSAALSLILRLFGRDADPAPSREHVLLSVTRIASRWRVPDKP